MIYLDSSAVVKLVRLEVWTSGLVSWLGERPGPSLASSVLVDVEVSRALRRSAPEALAGLPGTLGRPYRVDLDTRGGPWRPGTRSPGRAVCMPSTWPPPNAWRQAPRALPPVSPTMNACFWQQVGAACSSAALGSVPAPPAVPGAAARPGAVRLRRATAPRLRLAWRNEHGAARCPGRGLSPRRDGAR